MDAAAFATVQENGFEGILYPGSGSREKVLIVVSGSNGGMNVTAEIAEFYHRNGIPALAVALFNTRQTVKGLDRVPLEYIESAIAWLKARGYRKIGMDGASKGSELTLLCASLFSDISCVIARVPSHFVSEGLVANGLSKKPSGTSCWSYRGKEFPFAPYRSRKFNLLKLFAAWRELHLIAVNADKDVTEETVIPVENIKAPVLLLSAVQDEVWPSYESGKYIENRLREKQFPFPYRHVAFPTLSHAMLTELSPVYRLAFRTERENRAQCAAEREQLRRELLSWVRQVWA